MAAAAGHIVPTSRKERERGRERKRERERERERGREREMLRFLKLGRAHRMVSLTFRVDWPTSINLI
jgi:hypothetical protein